MKVLFVLLALIVSALSARVFHLEDNNDFAKYQLLLAGYRESVDHYDNVVTPKLSESVMSYYLYTTNNPDVPHSITTSNVEELSRSPHFNPQQRTVFIIHGWVDSHTADVNTLVKAAILSKLNANIIVVDWSPVAALSYTEAQRSVTDIGRFVGNFINSMIDRYGISANQITLIGHSLGAHISGNAGAVIRSKVYQIIGLDPAAPSFTVNNIDNRLDSNDAQYVQIIHTNGRFLGFSTSIGHVDYYPNGGMVQAGCGIDLLGVCSHARAFQYLAEAISGGKFTATRCTSHSDYNNKKCTTNKTSLLGSLDVDPSVVGDYYLNTNTTAPFALG